MIVLHKKIINFNIQKIIDIILMLLLFFYIFSCSFNMFKNPGFKCLGAVISFVFIYYYLFKLFSKIQSKGEKNIKIFILFFSLLIYVCWNLYAKIPLDNDYKILFNGAKEFASGNFKSLTFDKHNYFYMWNFQIGYAIFLGLIMKLIGTKLILFKFLEFAYLSITNLLIYLILKKITNNKIALLATIIYSSYLFIILGSGIINNQHVSLLLALLGIYFITNPKKERLFYKFLCGLLLAIGYILRQTDLLFLISLVCYYIWLIINDKNKYIKKSLISIFVICLTFFATTNIYDLVLKQTGYVPKSALKGNSKYFKYVLGIQWSNIKGFSTSDDLEYYNWNYDVYNRNTKNYIIDNYKHHLFDKVIPFQIEKMMHFAGVEDNQFKYAGDFSENNIIPQSLVYFGYAQYLLVIISSFLTIRFFYKKDRTSNNFLDFWKINFILVFCAYVFIEVQTRYRYDQYVSLAIFAAPALLIMFDYIDMLKININKKIKRNKKIF